MLYRVPYRPLSSRAKNKAEIAYTLEKIPGEKNAFYAVAKPDAPTVTFEARTLAEAAGMLQSLILPHDPRPVKGRTQVGMFGIPDRQAEAREITEIHREQDRYRV